MFAKLQGLEKKYMELEQALADPAVYNDQEQYRKLTKAHADLKDVVELFRKYRSLSEQIEENKELLHDSDPEIKEMAETEIREDEAQLPELERQLKIQLIPKDPLDEKNTMLEIRAGTGGEEAALFAADLFRMYSRYAELKGWKVEVMSESPTEAGGYKEIICLISGDRVYSHLKFEAGTHRVQRVPATETQGRIHTSAATVAVMPEAEDVDVDIKPEDLRIDVYRASGAGGQHINKTSSAVRLIHKPTGIVVSCQTQRDQFQNRETCMRMLRSKLIEIKEREHLDKISDIKGAQLKIEWGSQIRNYVFMPYTLVKDTRTGFETSNVNAVMDGALDGFINAYLTCLATNTWVTKS